LSPTFTTSIRTELVSACLLGLSLLASTVLEPQRGVTSTVVAFAANVTSSTTLAPVYSALAA
jgi:hypothetical protein